MREDILAKRGDDALGRRRQEIHLHEVHHALEREESEERDGDPIEQPAVAPLERGVEQVSNDLRKREPDPRCNEQTHAGNREPSAKRLDSREKLGERFWRTRASRLLCDGRRRQLSSPRSTTIAAKSSAR